MHFHSSHYFCLSEILLWTIPHLCTYRLVLLPSNMAPREPPWPSGQKRERSDSFDDHLCASIPVFRHRAPFQRPPYAINALSSSTLESRQQNKRSRVISGVKSSNSKNTVQTTTNPSRTLRQGSTSSVGVSLLDAVESENVEKVVVTHRETGAIWYRTP